MRRLVLLVLVACAAGYGPGAVFTHTSPLSGNAEIARRALPPLRHRRVLETLDAHHQQFADQAIDLAKERFDIYVPPGPPPPAGYGLVVFVAPWQDATVPHYWQSPLDHHHLIFVSARESGNFQSILDRRLPLAILAYANAKASYPIDDNRVYIAGLSGGSRVAEIAALAYPDIFRGVILNAGADPIDGRFGIYKPPADLFAKFQRTRIVVITGDQDEEVQRQDDLTVASLRDACVFDIKTEVWHAGHESLDNIALERALDALESPRTLDPDAIDRCNAKVSHALDARLAEVAAALARGDRTKARDLLNVIDANFGGLAAPRSLELDAQLAGS